MTTEKDDLVEPDFTTADMLEVFASGGNGSEYVDAFWLLNKAAKELREAAARITELEQQLAEAKEALKPFAEFAPKVEQFIDGTVTFGGSPIMSTKAFSLADFRRAAHALSGKGET